MVCGTAGTGGAVMEYRVTFPNTEYITDAEAREQAWVPSDSMHWSPGEADEDIVVSWGHHKPGHWEYIHGRRVECAGLSWFRVLSRRGYRGPYTVRPWDLRAIRRRCGYGQFVEHSVDWKAEDWGACWISDGSMAFWTGALEDKAAKGLRKRPDKAGGRYFDQNKFIDRVVLDYCWSDEHVAAMPWMLLRAYGDPREVPDADTICQCLIGGRPRPRYWVNARRLGLLLKILPVDRITVSRRALAAKRVPLVFWHKDNPVGMLMPLRTPHTPRIRILSGGMI